MSEAQDLRRIPDWALLMTVFITGASVLVIEIIGTRILAPFFGSGIYTWSALISITLAALALGYAVGGRMADHKPHAGLLYSMCLIAGVWTILTPIIAKLLLSELMHIADMRLAVLASGILLFFPNLFLLGAIGPFAIRLITRQQTEVGSTSGRVFAVSTVGSLLAALGTGFILIPNFGVQAIFTATGAVLIMLAIIGNFRPMFVSLALCFITVVVLLRIFTGQQSTAHATIEVLEKTPSFYGNLHVIRKDDEKWLLADGIGQNYVQQNKRWVTPYLTFISALPAMHNHKPTNANTGVVIGLGAGQLPLMLEQAGVQVDVVEIDEKIGLLAQNHFGFTLPGERIHYMDGRQFFARTDKQFDYIILDAFSAEQVAWHLLSKEALVEVREGLTATGLLAINMTSLPTGEDIAALQNTLQTVFPYNRVFTMDSSHKLQSIVFVSSSGPIDFSGHDERIDPAKHLIVRSFIAGELFDLGSNLVLTDDYNPINYQRKQVQLLWRQSMIDYFEDDDLSWLLF